MTVEPGEYTVRVALGSSQMTKNVLVERDLRVNLTPQETSQRGQAITELFEMAKTADASQRQFTALRTALTDQQRRLPENVQKTLDDLKKKMDSIEKVPEGRGGGSGEYVPRAGVPAHLDAAQRNRRLRVPADQRTVGRNSEAAHGDGRRRRQDQTARRRRSARAQQINERCGSAAHFARRPGSRSGRPATLVRWGGPPGLRPTPPSAFRLSPKARPGGPARTRASAPLERLLRRRDRVPSRIARLQVIFRQRRPVGPGDAVQIVDHLAVFEGQLADDLLRTPEPRSRTAISV